MTNKRKLLEKFLHHPAGTHYRNLEQVLAHLGFEKVRAKGSHIKFKHPGGRKDLIIPVHNGDCKAFYKKLAAKIIKNL